MIRCRCGTYTNFGLTCSKCAAEIWNGTPPPPEESKDEEEEVELVSLDELEEENDED